MDRCPDCGTLLAASLVKAIRIGAGDERCPRAPKPTPRKVEKREPLSRDMLTTYMLLGSMLRAES